MNIIFIFYKSHLFVCLNFASFLCDTSIYYFASCAYVNLPSRNNIKSFLLRKSDSKHFYSNIICQLINNYSKWLYSSTIPISNVVKV